MAVATQVKLNTLEDLLERLGNVPLSRVRMDPLPGLATEADVLEAERKHNILCELVDGVLVEKGIGYPESILAAALIEILRRHVKPRKLGLVSAPYGMVRLFAGLIRIPDVCFASWDRFPDRNVPKKPVPSLVPDLVVEVLSESNTVPEMERNRKEYFDAGVRLIWEIDPKLRTASVYRPDGAVELLDASQRLHGGDVLPDFTLELSELFAELDEEG